MAWRPQPNDSFYRVIVRTGLALHRLFRIRVIVTGRENLPAPEPLAGSPAGSSRRVAAGRGAVVAITHFGYLDFAFAELLLWWHSGTQMRFRVTKGEADTRRPRGGRPGGHRQVAAHPAGRDRRRDRGLPAGPAPRARGGCRRTPAAKPPAKRGASEEGRQRLDEAEGRAGGRRR